ncbi:MAG: DTW domain-containing protein [Colwellia sp.]|nr:DTW domain-containing protein [Colwellia sp.]
MSRLLCSTCQRPKLACICQFVSTINNDILVVVLLHPKEVNQSKGTLPLLAGSLSNLLVIEGENFNDNKQLNNILAKYNQQVALLYPSEDAAEVSNLKSNNGDYKCLILLDATWKKAYRMYMLSKNLHLISHIALPENIVGQYAIRKTNKKNALSTLEACCYALEILENSPCKYQGLLEKFVEFNQFQLSFRK